VGTVYIGAARGETVWVRKLFISRSSRSLVRMRAAQSALEMALRLAQEKQPQDAVSLAKAEQHTQAALDALNAVFVNG
jgi:nicotinamide-nucleotide amidase